MTIRKVFFLFVLTILASATLAVAADPTATLTPEAKQVRKALIKLPYYSVFDILNFEIDGNKVILSGETIRPTLRKTAEAAVRRIEWVDAVENRIEVLPLSSYDDSIRLAVFRAIYGSSTFVRQRSYLPIHIIVKNGSVVLEGSVGSKLEKTVARVRASGVSGVFSVTDRLAVT